MAQGAKASPGNIVKPNNLLNIGFDVDSCRDQTYGHGVTAKATNGWSCNWEPASVFAPAALLISARIPQAT